MQMGSHLQVVKVARDAQFKQKSCYGNYPSIFNCVNVVSFMPLFQTVDTPDVLISK